MLASGALPLILNLHWPFCAWVALLVVRLAPGAVIPVVVLVVGSRVDPFCITPTASTMANFTVRQHCMHNATLARCCVARLCWHFSMHEFASWEMHGRVVFEYLSGANVEVVLLARPAQDRLVRLRHLLSDFALLWVVFVVDSCV